MHNICLLTKILLIAQFKSFKTRSQTISSKKKKSTKLSNITMGIAYVILVSYLVVLFGFLFNMLIDMGIQLNMHELPIAILLIISISFALLTMVFGMVSTLYYDSTNTILLPLPFTSIDILGAKSLVLLIDIWIELVIFSIAPLALMLLKMDLSIFRFIVLIIVNASICIIPCCILGSLLMIAMRYSKVFYNKKRVQLVTFIGFFIIYFYFISGFVSNGDMMEDSGAIIAILQSLMDGMIAYYPPLRLAMYGILDSNLLTMIGNLLAYLGCTMIFVVIYLLIGKSIYLKGLVASMLNGGKKKIQSLSMKAFKAHSPLVGYIRKELTTIFNSATFIIQLVLPVYLIGAIIVIMMVVSMMQEQLNINELITMLHSLPIEQWLVFGLSAFMLFIASFDYSGAVMISKDGHNASWMRVIPMSATMQSHGKLISACLIRLPLLIITTMLLLIFNVVSPLGCVVYFMILLAHLLIDHVFGLWNDARKPLLDWTSEIQAVKNNTKAIVGMLFNLLTGFIIGALCFMIVYFVKDSNIALLGMFMVSIVMIVLTIFIYGHTSSRLLDNIH